MENIYKYPDGINASHFSEICRMLLNGVSVEFNCGAGMHYREMPSELKNSFKKHVDSWVGDINGHMQEYFRKDYELKYDYFSPDDWRKVRVYTPVKPENNIMAKRFLSKEY